MMITMNLHNAFFILMCSYALFSTFRESFRADCIEQFTTFERQFFRCLLAGFRTSPATSYREDAGNGAYGFPSISKNSKPFADVIAQAAAHSPQIFNDSECWSGLGLEPSTSGALQRELNRQQVFESLLTFSYAFTHITDIDTPDTIDTWGAVTCYKPHNPLLTKSENRMLMAYV